MLNVLFVDCYGYFQPELILSPPPPKKAVSLKAQVMVRDCLILNLLCLCWVQGGRGVEVWTKRNDHPDTE